MAKQLPGLGPEFFVMCKIKECRTDPENRICRIW